MARGFDERVDVGEVRMSLRKDYKGIAKLNAGPGGWHCNCCNPFGCNPRKMKPLARRHVRRVFKQMTRNIPQET